MNIQAALVRAILEQWRSYTWTVQGFGFIRTKLADIGRIHVWDSSLACMRVSTAHNHPWPLRSTIISGELINQRFAIADRKLQGVLPYNGAIIQTGEGGGIIEDSVTQLGLSPQSPEVYGAGQTYTQAGDEIHRTIAQDGTVTLMERPQGPPDEKACVYWPAGTEWVSAEPRPAKPFEVETAVNWALMRWYA